MSWYEEDDSSTDYSESDEYYGEDDLKTLAENLAEEYNWRKTGDHPNSRVVVFDRVEGNGQNRMVLSVYYTTQTVGSALDHPRQGKTQLWRRNVDFRGGQLEEIFQNPRVHGCGEGGYYRT